MQCLSFCLFGVYGVDGEKRIQVQNQDNCKTNCPACSRVCPEAAIMFPKYKAGPINGDVVSDADLNREKMKVDFAQMKAALDRMMREIAAVQKLSETEALKVIDGQLKKNQKRAVKPDAPEGEEAEVEEAA